MVRQRKTQHENVTDYGSEKYGSPGRARRGDSFAIGHVPPAPSSAPFVNGSITGEPAAYSSANAQYNGPTGHHYAPPEAWMMQDIPNSYAHAGEPPRQPIPREMLPFQGKITDRIRHSDAPTSINATGKFDENRDRQSLQSYHSEANPSAGNVLSLCQGPYDQNSFWATMPQQHRQMSFPDHPAQSMGPLHGDSTKPWGSFDGSTPDALPFGTANQYLEQPAKLRASSRPFPGETTGFKSCQDPIDQRRVSRGSTVDCDPSMSSYSHQHGLAWIPEERCYQGLHQPMFTPQEATRPQKIFSTAPGLAIPTPFYPYDKSITSKEHLDHPNGIANEEGVQALKKTKRKRKDGNTKTRTLTAHGKVHANKIRKAGACSACRRSHTKVLKHHGACAFSVGSLYNSAPTYCQRIKNCIVPRTQIL